MYVTLSDSCNSDEERDTDIHEWSANKNVGFYRKSPLAKPNHASRELKAISANALRLSVRLSEKSLGASILHRARSGIVE